MQATKYFKNSELIKIVSEPKNIMPKAKPKNTGTVVIHNVLSNNSNIFLYIKIKFFILFLKIMSIL